LKIRAKHNIVLPKYLFLKVIGACENIIQGLPFNGEKNSTLLEDFTKKVTQLEIDQTQKNILIEAAKTALLKSVKPAYTDLITYLKTQEEKANNYSG